MFLTVNEGCVGNREVYEGFRKYRGFKNICVKTVKKNLCILSTMKIGLRNRVNNYEPICLVGNNIDCSLALDI